MPLTPHARRLTHLLQRPLRTTCSRDASRRCSPPRQQRRWSGAVQARRQLSLRAAAQAGPAGAAPTAPALLPEGPLSAYVHLPFCKRRCYYCDFPVQAIGSEPGSSRVQSTMQQYVDVLCAEIGATAVLGDRPLQTVFFGGGTPSLTPPAMLRQVLDALAARFGIAEGAEVSMEADPGTFDAQRLREYMTLGVSRFSIGVQAFQEEVLQRIGRSHGLEDVWCALRDVRAAGVANWSLDLISGLPHASLADWRHSLEQALAARPPHISVYDLQVEEGTHFGRLYAPGQAPLPDDDSAAQMFRVASQMLRAAGMEHYEISSYAAPGHRCRHNSAYWTGEPFYAFGLGAVSLLQRRRWSRPRAMAAYRRWVAAFAAAGEGVPGLEQEPEGRTDALLDAVMLRLRLAEGLDLRWVKGEHGPAAVKVLQTAAAPHLKRGLVQPTSHGFSLVDPEGFLLSNDIISDLFAAVDRAEQAGKLYAA